MEKVHDKKEVQVISQLGLSQKEAAVYLAALESGGATITELAKIAQIERTGIYYHIDKLLALNLLKEISHGKRSVYTAADPAVLKSMLTHRQKELEEILPSMKRQYMQQTSQSITENFIGQDRIKAFYDRLYEILCMEQGQTVYCFGHSYRAVSITGKDFLEYKKPNTQISIETKVILPFSQKSKIQSENRMDPYIVERFNLPVAEKKYLKDKYYPSPVIIVGSKIVLFDYTNSIFSINENKNVAATWRMLFEYIWDSLK